MFDSTAVLEEVAEWKKERKLSTKVAMLLSCTLLFIALCLGRQAVKVAVKAWPLAWFIDIFSWREGSHWIDSFCNFLTLHHCTFLFTMPQPLCPDCCQGSLTGWRKEAGEAAQWNRTHEGSLIHLSHCCCCHVPQRWNNCFMDSFHLYLVSKCVSLPVEAMPTTKK